MPVTANIPIAVNESGFGPHPKSKRGIPKIGIARTIEKRVASDSSITKTVFLTASLFDPRKIVEKIA